MDFSKELQAKAKDILGDKAWFYPCVMIYRKGASLPRLNWCESLHDNIPEALKAAATKAGIDITLVDMGKARQIFQNNDLVTVIEVLPAEKEIAEIVTHKIELTFRSESGFKDT
jgi:hypothetical protein